MDLFCGNSNDSQASKVQSLDVSPINSQNFIGRGRFYPGPKTRILDPYTSSDSSGSSSNRVLSPLARYLHSSSPVSFASDSPERRSLVNTSSGSRSGSGSGGVFRSPLASIENIEILPAFRTPVKVEEDVVVMDGILVEPKHGARAKSSPSTSDSGGRWSSSTSGSENSSHMSEVCRWWGDTGTCRFGSKCRFVHGKEDLRPTAFATWNHSEAPSSRSYSSGSCAYGPRGRSAHHQVNSAASSTESAAMATPTAVKKIVSTKDKEPPSSDSSPSSTTSTIGISGTDWSPLDDNIEVSLPSGEKCPSREDVDAHIQTVLYGLSGRKRLPVCVEFSEE
ncbi:uncharacterized protein LOC107764752 [Nicotiana tabacum]|uniref:Uncharacterized protein LOC107764752 n=1 Tax=Nicotiana tabacum TaxID=4097 RepID=A0AC58S2B5_TOBAC